jgi:hypothetical protein
MHLGQVRMIAWRRRFAAALGGGSGPDSVTVTTGGQIQEDKSKYIKQITDQNTTQAHTKSQSKTIAGPDRAIKTTKREKGRGE